MVKIQWDPFIFKGHKTKECLELVHIDVYGTFKVHTWESMGTSSLLLINTLGYVYLVHKKIDALDTFIELKEESDNLLGTHINALWLDWGGVSNRFDSFHRRIGLHLS